MLASHVAALLLCAVQVQEPEKQELELLGLLDGLLLPVEGPVPLSQELRLDLSQEQPTTHLSLSQRLTALFTTSLHGEPQDADRKRLAVPAESERAGARQTVEAVLELRKVFSSKDRISIERIASRALELGRDDKHNAPAAVYELISSAIEGGVIVGSVTLVREATDELNKRFEIDRADLLLSSAQAMARDPQSRARPEELVDLFIEIGRIAGTAIPSRVSLAKEALKGAATQQDRLRKNKVLHARLGKELDRMRGSINLAEEESALRAEASMTPPNAKSAEKLGWLLCLRRERWREGLALLAEHCTLTLKSGLSVRQLAQWDRAAEVSDDQAWRVAEGWREFLGSEHCRSEDNAAVRRHASEWYRRLLHLQDLRKHRVETFLAESESVLTIVPEVMPISDSRPSPVMAPDHIWTLEECRDLAAQIRADKLAYGPAVLASDPLKNRALLDGIDSAHNWATAAQESARMQDAEEAHTRAETAIILWNAFRRAAGLVEKSAEGESIPTNMEEAFGTTYAQGWTIETSLVKSPAPTSAETSWVFSRLSLDGDGNFGVEAKRPDAQSNAGLLFGKQEAEDYFILDFVYEKPERECYVAAYHWNGKSLKDLGRTAFELSSAQRSNWIGMSVEVKGKRVKCCVGGVERLSFTTHRSPLGRIGLYVSAASLYDGPVLYRRLRVERVGMKAGGK